MEKFRNLRLQAKRIVISSVLMIFMACNKDIPVDDRGGQGNHDHTTLHIFLTDDPALVFDHVYLQIMKVEVKAEDDAQMEREREHSAEIDDNDRHGDSSGGWVTMNMQPGIYDIIQFRNGLDTMLASGNFPTANTLKKVRLVLGTQNQVVYQGNSFPLVIKDEGNTVLIKLEDDFAPANGGSSLDFSLDFDAGRSIRFHNNAFEWVSDIRAFRKEQSGSVEGRALPGAAKIVVTATNGVDSSTAMAEAEGEFKITGLKPGDYSLNFHANAGSYMDTTILHVTVREQEDTHIGTITLHP